MANTTADHGWAAQIEMMWGKRHEFTVLVLDNRGVGRSSAPLLPYSVATMADDTLCLLSEIGWLVTQ